MTTYDITPHVEGIEPSRKKAVEVGKWRRITDEGKKHMSNSPV
jgi:hypothetical protein